MGDFFFADETGALPETLDWKEVDLIYNDYIRVMTCMHQKLKHTFNQFVTKLLTEDQRTQHNLHVEKNGLILPGMPFDLPETTNNLDSTKTKNNKSMDSFEGEETKDELVDDSFAERKAGDMASIPPPTLKNN